MDTLDIRFYWQLPSEAQARIKEDVKPLCLHGSDEMAQEAKRRFKDCRARALRKETEKAQRELKEERRARAKAEQSLEDFKGVVKALKALWDNL